MRKGADGKKRRREEEKKRRREEEKKRKVGCSHKLQVAIRQHKRQ